MGINSKNVGASNRTPGKHDALDKILGKTVGVHSKEFRRKRLVIIDCTAGNGMPSEYSPKTSPGIIDKHAHWLENQNVRVDVTFFERCAQSHDTLRSRFPHRNTICGDSKDMAKTWDRNSVLFVVNDPNTVNDWSLPASLRFAPQLTTVFSTLGCNVGGLKMLPAEKREVWYEHVQQQLNLLQPWHAAYIASLENDSSQWAYLVNAPLVWKKSTEDAFALAFKNTGFNVCGAWTGSKSSQTDKDAFRSIIDRLLKTKKEMKNVY